MVAAPARLHGDGVLCERAAADLAEKCLAAGCDDFLVEPIEPRRLLEALGAYDAAPTSSP